MPGRKNRVFVVDDDSRMLHSIGMLLNSLGFSAKLYASAEAFLSDSTVCEPCNRCLVLDIHLAGMSGIELGKRLTDIGRPLPIIFITGNDNAAVRRAAWQQGCIAYLAKPFTAKALAGAIEKALAQLGRNMRPSDRLWTLSSNPLRRNENGKTATSHVVDFARGDAARESLRDGRKIEIRALRPDDRAELLAAIQQVSTESLYRRFFGVKRNFTDKEIDFFLNIDFVNHVALVAVIEESGRPAIVGGGRYVVVRPATAELAFAVVDQYQGLSIGAALIRYLIGIARNADLTYLVADVLPNNTPMLKVFERSGLPVGMRREGESVHVSLQLR